jgi:hypothetical protein
VSFSSISKEKAVLINKNITVINKLLLIISFNYFNQCK